MAMVKTKLSSSPFSINLGKKRRKKLFEMTLTESAKRKRHVTVGEIIREMIDKESKN